MAETLASSTGMDDVFGECSLGLSEMCARGTVASWRAWVYCPSLILQSAKMLSFHWLVKWTSIG